MCGIYGTTLTYDEQQVKKKLERTSFRGPDKMGWQTYQNGRSKVTFGHNRLSIIDLDPRSNQPFAYYDKVHIVFNGEIYNFQVLKKQLKGKGYQFKTTSDTEVICAAYMEYGEQCVHYLNGMFAFVIYDVDQQILFGAKDRLGQKPLYYYYDGTDFEFASQISSIQMFNSNLSISKHAINEYLAWDYIPAPYSIFNEVKKLEDGFSFVFDLTNRTFLKKQYWDIDYTGQNYFKGSFEQAQDHLEELLTDAVRIRLFADVPVGVFLSGGIDSSLVAAMATKTTDEKVKTFSVKFNEKEYDESTYAQAVADHLRTDHHVIECDYKEGIEFVKDFSTYYDEPFADSSAIPSMLLSKHTRQEVTVALSGDAGDENFLGYTKYVWVRSNKKIFQIPQGIRNIGASILEPMPYKNNRLSTIAQYLRTPTIEHAFIKSRTSPNTSWLERNEINYDFDECKYLFHNNKNIYERASDFDLKTYLPNDINTKVDRASMAFSLEVRAPLLDYRVVEFAESLPTSFKFTQDDQKKILKKILYKHVPKKVFERPKSGFAVPLKIWFRGELKDYVMSELSERNLGQIPGIKVNEVLELIKQHMDESWNHNSIIWKLLVLRQWLDKNGQGRTMK